VRVIIVRVECECDQGAELRLIYIQMYRCILMSPFWYYINKLETAAKILRDRPKPID
jgi:hypothetical protein